MMLNYIEQTETEITERLQGIATNLIRVHPAPETDADRPEPSSVRSNVFVMYTGSRFGESRSTNDVSQDEFYQFAVVIESPFLRGEFGIYQVKKKVIDRLLGFQPSNSNRLTAVNAGFNTEKMLQENGVFTFPVVFETRGMAVQVDDYTDEPGPLISQITVPEPKISQVDNGAPFVAAEDNVIFIDDDNYPIK